MHHPILRPRTLAVLTLVLGCSSAFAGRPLTVDDANTNDAGAGHVEAWVARDAGSTVVTVAPAYAPIDGLEFGLALSRDITAKVNASTVQAKWRITPSQEKGCNLGISAGLSRESGGDGTTRFVNGLGSCNFGSQGSLHLNLGLVKTPGTSSVKVWGLAFEREVGGVTPHLEWFGEKGGKPTVQVGARAQVAAGWQLDGTVGRHDGDNLYSLGLKFQF